MIRNQTNPARMTTSHLLSAGMCLLALPGLMGATEGVAGDSYKWSAELVAFDEAGKTVTVQARIVDHSEVADLSAFSEGDQVLLTWSGAHGSATGVRNITDGTTVDEGELFTMPVEFVSTALKDRYVRFKVPVPAADVQKIKTLKPGVWVTATSPQEPGSQTEAVSGIQPYNS